MNFVSSKFVSCLIVSFLASFFSLLFHVLGLHVDNCPSLVKERLLASFELRLLGLVLIIHPFGLSLELREEFLSWPFVELFNPFLRRLFNFPECCVEVLDACQLRLDRHDVLLELGNAVDQLGFYVGDDQAAPSEHVDEVLRQVEHVVSRALQPIGVVEELFKVVQAHLVNLVLLDLAVILLVGIDSILVVGLLLAGIGDEDVLDAVELVVGSLLNHHKFLAHLVLLFLALFRVNH